MVGSPLDIQVENSECCNGTKIKLDYMSFLTEGEIDPLLKDYYCLKKKNQEEFTAKGLK